MSRREPERGQNAVAKMQGEKDITKEQRLNDGLVN